MGMIKGYDADTLREIVDPGECTTRLAELGDQRSLPAMLERVWLLKVLERLDEALPLSEQVVRHARMAGTRKDVLRARVLHATVQQRRGAHPAAVAELNACTEEADGQEWAALSAFAHQHRAKVHFEAGDYAAARADFTRTLFLRQQTGASDQQLESVLHAIETCDRRRTTDAVAS
ncbi:hypothetical protein [Microbacterium sp.]|uniref:hypothetical protein n=1 Tax=Microbacterium sp. TaxID=51671 RepID=UPI003A841547